MKREKDVENMDELYILGWYLLVTIVSFFALHSDSFVFLKKIRSEVRAERGILLVQLIASWLVILAPSYLFKNTLNVLRDIVEPNTGTVAVLLLCLMLAGLLIAYTFHLRTEGNGFASVVTLIIALLSLVSFVVLLVVVIPLEIAPCACKYGFYGSGCESSCSIDGQICSGHGTCNPLLGCQCDDRFQGKLCDGCINMYMYETNCESCHDGYSLLDQCTKCSIGRDRLSDPPCSKCLSSYLQTNSSDECTDCTAFHFKPSNLPSRESYNSFLAAGGSDVCTPCPSVNNEVCNGHGTCSHWQSLQDDGSILGIDASGLCDCDIGYFPPLCERIPGYDLENSESICNGHGEAYAVYEVQDGNYEQFKELLCKCSDDYYPTFSPLDTACSEKRDAFGGVVECIYGYYLNTTLDTCFPCAGGGFLSGCNSNRQGGYCTSEGECICSLSYGALGAGGYVGEDCKKCDLNFYKDSLAEDPERCTPCPRTFGPLITDACNSGKGYCVTEGRIKKWIEGFGHDTSADSYHAYENSVEVVVGLENLQNYLGQCLCKSGFSTILDGSCN